MGVQNVILPRGLYFFTLCSLSFIHGFLPARRRKTDYIINMALLPRPRRGLRGIVFTRSVCLSVCLSVCVCVCVCLCVRPIFGILFLGYQKRYRSEIYTGYLYSCTQFNDKY